MLTAARRSQIPGWENALPTGHDVLNMREETDKSGEVDNDATLENLSRLAVSYAKAGVDVVAPSGMMDGAVAFLRDSLDEEEKLKVKQVTEHCPELAALAGHITAFAEMLTSRHGERLDAWIADADASGLPDLRSFVTGLKRDHDAVRNGLTLPWNSGAVEGNVNRIKMIKRQMYGRAGFPLLRKRVLVAT